MQQPPAPSAANKPHADPLSVLWTATSVLWLLGCGVALALILTLASAPAEPWAYFTRMLLATQWVLLLTLGMLYAFRNPLSRTKPHQLLLIATALLAANAWMTAEAVWMLVRGGMVMPVEWWRTFSMRMTATATIVGLLAAVAINIHWRSQQLAIRAKQAELDALRARVNPHFLFNTLNTATALVHSRPAQAEQVLLDLSDLFRAALSRSGEHPLADELALARRYLEIEQLRMGSRLEAAWHLPTDIPSIMVPTLSLQALVENAIQHGLERMPGGGKVDIALERRDGHVVAGVVNPVPTDGQARRPPVTGHGVGLAAARTRIESMQPPGRLDVRVDGPLHVAEAWFGVRGDA